jgi:hypothetical protein
VVVVCDLWCVFCFVFLRFRLGYRSLVLGLASCVFVSWTYASFPLIPYFPARPFKDHPG